MTDFTDDTFLGGRICARQPLGGFRSGLDAVVVAAAVPAQANDRILELGAGAGIASLCLAARVVNCELVGVEIDPRLVAVANANAGTNGFDTRVTFVEADVTALPQNLRIEFDHVFCNPPFHADDQRSPDTARAMATHGATLADWIKTGFARSRSGGTFTAIVRADRLATVLETTGSEGVTVFPLWPHAGTPAKRVILQVCRSSRAPFVLLAGMVLHRSDGAYTDQADAVLRGGAALALR